MTAAPTVQEPGFAQRCEVFRDGAWAELQAHRQLRRTGRVGQRRQDGRAPRPSRRLRASGAGMRCAQSAATPRRRDTGRPTLGCTPDRSARRSWARRRRSAREQGPRRRARAPRPAVPGARVRCPATPCRGAGSRTPRQGRPEPAARRDGQGGKVAVGPGHLQRPSRRPRLRRVAVRPAALRGTAWHANIGRNPLCSTSTWRLVVISRTISGRCNTARAPAAYRIWACGCWGSSSGDGLTCGWQCEDEPGWRAG